MTRKKLAFALLSLLVWSSAWAQHTRPVASQGVNPHVFTIFGVFERVPEGWMCRYAGKQLPSLLRELQIGDVLVSIDSQNLATTTPIGMYQQLRLVEFELAGMVEALRAGQRLKWKNPDLPPQIIASQSSLEVMQSTQVGIRPGDILKSIGPAQFKAILAQLDNPLTSLATVNVKPGKILHCTRDGQEKEIVADSAAVVRLVQFDLEPAQEVPSDALLRGLNTGDVTVASLRGHWTLLHFWATWCVPCRRHLPEIRELAQQKDLTIAAIGFADAEDRLSAAGAQDRNVRIFAPSTALQQQLAITGIPFDVLLDPEGKAVLLVSGDMRARFSDIVMQFVRR